LGLSLVYPGSSCPRCGHKLRPYELVPIFSFLFLLGKCKECKEPISWRYPAIEILTGLLFFSTFMVFGVQLVTLKMFVFISLVIVIAFIDLENMIIPNVLSINTDIKKTTDNCTKYKSINGK
jgi:leader peptidase (prepilin peptidase)/N-methyltransferase